MIIESTCKRHKAMRKAGSVMENLSRLYGKFAGRIIVSLERCEEDVQCLEAVLGEFKNVGVIPRALLYRAIIEKNEKTIDLVQNLFRKEISLAILGSASLMDINAIAAEVEKEIAIWQKIWEQEKNL